MRRKLLGLPSFYLGVAMLIGGFVMMAISKVQFDVEVRPAGIAIMLLCSTFFGFYAVSVRYFLRGMNPLISFGVVSHMVSVGTILAMLLLGDYRTLLHVPLPDFGVLILSSVLGIALGHYFLYGAVARWEPPSHRAPRPSRRFPLCCWQVCCFTKH